MALTTDRRPRLAGILLGVLSCCAACGPSEPPPPPWPSAEAPEPVHDFGDVLQGERVEHAFRLANRGLEELRIQGVVADEPLVVGEHPMVVAPESEVEIPVTLDADSPGEGELTVSIETNDPERPETVLTARARVVAPVEVEPKSSIYFLEAVRGQTLEGAVTIVNHRKAPLEIEAVESVEPSSFEHSLETLEEGRRYRLEVRFADADFVGQIDETFTLVTDSPEVDPIPIRVVARIREAVHADPAQIVFGRFRTEDLGDPHVSTRQIRVRSPERPGLALIDVSSDLPFLELDVRTDERRSSHLLTVRIDAERLTEGPFAGTVRIETEDPDVPVLEVPVSGDPLSGGEVVR